jgi:hypothetical protein
MDKTNVMVIVKAVNFRQNHEKVKGEDMERLTEIKTHVTGFCYADKKEGVFIQDVFTKLAAYEDTGLTPEEIKAQQQEIDRLKATLDDWKYQVKCDTDHIRAFISDKDEQARKTRQLKEGLRSTLKVLETLNYRGGLGLDIHKWLRDEIQTINTLLGSEEDEKE